MSGPGAAAARHLRLRLELLGDAVWNLAVIQSLLREAKAPRADLARRKAHLAGGPFMADVARRVGLGGTLRIGPGPDAAALRDRPSVLASTLEAVLGAWYLQAGLPPVLRFVARALASAARHERPGASVDPKSDLQQVVTRRFHTLPAYRIVEQAGSAHAPEFRVEVAVNGRILGAGRGGSRRAAEQAAAWEALRALESSEKAIGAHKI
jgi:ribonuclease-3